MNPNDHNNKIQPIHTLEEIQQSRNQVPTSNQGQPVIPTVSSPAFDPNLENAKKKKKLLQRIRDNIKLIIYSATGLVAIVLIMTFVISPISVNGISMQPTFHTGDYVLDYKWPQTWAHITNTQYIPSVGQIVIVNDTTTKQELFIKRVIGIPGDEVNVTSGIVNIKNTSHPNGYNPDKTYPYGKTLSLYQPGMDFGGNVNNGQIFVMGDNRTPGASIDSRSSLGNIPSNYIIGRVLVKVWPINQFKLY